MYTFPTQRVLLDQIIIQFLHSLTLGSTIVPLSHSLIPSHLFTGVRWVGGAVLGWMLGLTVISALIVFLFPFVTKAVPSVLVAILITTAIGTRNISVVLNVSLNYRTRSRARYFVDWRQSLSRRRSSAIFDSFY